MLKARDKEAGMYVVRDIMYCKPGKARVLVEKFMAVAKAGDKMTWIDACDDRRER